MQDRSIICIRTSTKDDQEPKLQLADCEQYNSENDWSLIKVFEKQESAYKNEEGVWKEEIQFAIDNNVQHIIVWNMDRFSRLPPEVTLRMIQKLSLYQLKVHAVKGDAWSQVVESVGKLKELGFIGEAIAEFLEKILTGLEFQRAHNESKVKGERVQLAVRKSKDGVTRSYKGKKWGRRELPKRVVDEVIDLRKRGSSIRDIAKSVSYYDKNRNLRNVSVGTVSNILNGGAQ